MVATVYIRTRNTLPKMKNNKLLIGLGIVVALLLVFAVAGKKMGWIGKGEVQEVAVDKATKRAVIETVTASGKINPQTEVKLSSEVSGEVIQLYVKEGDSVKRGKLMAVINPAIYEAVVTQATASVNQLKASLASARATSIQAKASFEQAKRNFDRNTQLHNDKVISDAEFEAAKLQFDQASANYETAKEQINAATFSVSSAEAQLKQANDNLRKTTIYAPIDGIVSLVNVKLGERVVGTAQMAGTEIIRIADLNNMQAEVDVNENDVLRINNGDTAEIEVDAYIKKKFKGIVTQVSYSSTSSVGQVISTSQATNFTVKIKLLKESYADLINPAIGKLFPFRPGMSATVDIKTEAKENVLTVPIQSVTTREEKDLKDKDEEYAKTAAAKAKAKEDSKKDVSEIVFVVEKGKVVAKKVTTGIQDANYIEITSGLTEGEQVVKAPFKLISKTLKDGDAVQVVDEKDLFKENKEESN
ncbi:MAG TPA: efflux RND transporter periplasmic adaptor subunit [Chitinophagales bacterium]|nr:efflux RND transporter periplasmic adaptor subunit [Chitinophagales bacterium]